MVAAPLTSSAVHIKKDLEKARAAALLADGAAAERKPEPPDTEILPALA